jgi:hypothetical protein
MDKKTSIAPICARLRSKGTRNAILTIRGMQEIIANEKNRQIDRIELPPGIVPDFAMVTMAGIYIIVYAIHEITSDAFVIFVGK